MDEENVVYVYNGILFCYKTWFFAIFNNMDFVVVVVQLLSCVQFFCDPMNSSPPGLFVHGISQARN